MQNIYIACIGISKYKERRKETESRMHRTQENLNRLRDILEELEKICNSEINPAKEHNSLIYLFTQLLENSEKDGKCDVDLIIEELEYRLKKAKEVHSNKVA